jgi:excinuclease UvrABC nuclease subunit
MSYLYRTYGDDGRLLYVGQTDCIENRMQHHVRVGAPWLDQLASITLEQISESFACAATAYTINAAEREAIKTEWPLYNIQASIEDPRSPHLKTKLKPLRELLISDPERLQERKRRVEQALDEAALLLSPGGDSNAAA